MTVILVLSTFIVFLLIDHFFSKKHVVRIAVQPVAAAPRESVPRLQPSMVGEIVEILHEGTKRARRVAVDTMTEVRDAIKLEP